jgi:predicted enzyme related to lactoylglutathione lyase
VAVGRTREDAVVDDTMRRWVALPEQAFMVNFRVADLGAMLAQLRSAGVEVLDPLEESEHGRFGWAIDPEGTRFELWEPPPGH